MKPKTRADGRATRTARRRGKDSLISSAHTKFVSNAIRKLAIEYVSPDSLVLDPANPRVHGAKQILQITASIRAFGFIIPVVIDAMGRVISGHGRVEAAKALSLSVIPAIRIEHLTSMQARAFAIADNKLTENADWNEPLLAEQLKMLSEAELEFDVEVTGFEAAEIDLLIEGMDPVPDGQTDPADELPEATSAVSVSKPGYLWSLGRHRVLCGDATDQHSFAGLMGGQKAAAVFIDPPYNVKIGGHASGLGKTKHREFAMASGEMNEAQFTNFLTRAVAMLAANSTNGSLHYICIDWRHLSELLAAGKPIYQELKAVCVWNKQTGGMGSLYRSQHEFVFVFKNGAAPHRNNIQLGQFGRCRTNVWDYPGMNSFSRSTYEGHLLELHPTVKPVSLVADAIMDCTVRGDIVLDSFAGSGTTVIAAERTGRICYGIEMDPAYVDTIIRRWQTFSGLSATHVGSGRTFSQLEQEAANNDER
jgi:DNA modification methylase